MLEQVNNIQQRPYLGGGAYAVDASRRVLLPVHWRKEGYPTDFYIVPWPVMNERYLLVLPPPRFNTMLASLTEQSLADEGMSAVARWIVSNTTEVCLDKVGRLALPGEAAKRVGVEKEAHLVGGADKFEVWNPQKYAEDLARMEPLVAAALPRIKI